MQVTVPPTAPDRSRGARSARSAPLALPSCSLLHRLAPLAYPTTSKVRARLAPLAVPGFLSRCIGHAEVTVR